MKHFIVKYSTIICFIYLYSFFSYYKFTINIKISDYLFISSYFANPNIVEHTFNDYLKWRNNLFYIINNSIVIFTDYSKEAERIVKGFNNIKIHKFHSIWDLPCYNSYTKTMYENLLKDDPFYKVHNSFLYAIYNAKIWFLTKATELYKSNLYIWIDIGCIRDKIIFDSFPDIQSMNFLSNLDSMFFFVINNKQIYKYNDSLMVCSKLIEGGSYGGTKKRIKEFSYLFWRIHDIFITKKNCIYDDQNILLTAIIKYKKANLFNVFNKKMCTKLLWMKFICFYANYNKFGIVPDRINKYIKYAK